MYAIKYTGKCLPKCLPAHRDTDFLPDCPEEVDRWLLSAEVLAGDPMTRERDAATWGIRVLTDIQVML
jgi:hypothetical protein